MKVCITCQFGPGIPSQDWICQTVPMGVSMDNCGAFGGAIPRYLRVHTYRYRFSDSATREQMGAWWKREEIGTSNVIETARFSPAKRY